jgi:hypothetical protein
VRENSPGRGTLSSKKNRGFQMLYEEAFLLDQPDEYAADAYAV